MNTALSSLVKSGGRDTLIQDFRAVAEATTPEGALRYAEAPTLQWLAKFATGAAGGPNKDVPLFELCHLILALELCGAGRGDQRATFFLGLNPASPVTFKAFFQERTANKPLTIGAQEVAIDYGETTFAIRYGRMVRLVALYEFLAGLDAFAFFGEFNAILDKLVSDPLSMAAVKTASNALAGHMRQYRKAHLVAAEHDGKFTTLYTFLLDRGESECITIDDAAIFDFWALHNQRNDFKGYRTVFDLFFKFMLSLDEVTSRRAAQDAGQLGVERELGEIDPAPMDIQDFSGEWESPLHLFEETPLDAIKFFKKSSELKPLEPLMTYGPKVQSLPLAFLRYEVFGRIQSGITNDLQIGRGAASVENRIRCTDAEPYPQRRELYAGLLGHVRQLVQASLYVLTQAERDKDRDRDRDTGKVIAFPGASLPEGETAAVADDGAKAFKALTRKGFEDGVLGDPERTQAFKRAADPLLAVSVRLEGVLGALETLDLDALFAADVDAFRQQFTALYGERS